MMQKLPIDNPQPNIDNFISVIRGEAVPSRPPLVELYLDHEVVRDIYTRFIGSDWVEPSDDVDQQKAYLRNWIKTHYMLGYDYVRMAGGMYVSSKPRIAEDTAELAKQSRSWMEEGTGPISSWADFESYPWDSIVLKDMLWQYDFVANNLPEGMGMLVCPASGFLEIPLDILFGYEGLCYLLYDEPDLVEAVFQKMGDIIYKFYENLIGLPNLYGFFQGDDMGYKTGTMIAAEHLRKYIFPWHKKTAALAHDSGLVYLLHSCGHLDEIMDELIDDVKIDGRHSYEDEGNPVFDFKKNYGNRVAVLGGVDMDKLCRLPEPELRSYVRQVIDACLPGGRFALGSGNSVANYVPVSNYLAMIDEGLHYGER